MSRMISVPSPTSASVASAAPPAAPLPGKLIRLLSAVEPDLEIIYVNPCKYYSNMRKNVPRLVVWGVQPTSDLPFASQPSDDPALEGPIDCPAKADPPLHPEML
jgi:hypothetical protein